MRRCVTVLSCRQRDVPASHDRTNCSKQTCVYKERLLNESHWTYRLQEKVFSRYRPISQTVFTVLLLSGLWFVLRDRAVTTGPVAVALAQLSGVLGGLVLLAYLVSKQDLRVRRDLMWISLLLMIATASFALAGLISLASFVGNFGDHDLVHSVVAGLSFAIGGLSFSAAISYLILLIGRLYEADALSSSATNEPDPQSSPASSEEE